MANIANIEIKGLKKQDPKLKSDTGLIIKFYQTKETLKNLEVRNAFIKGVEKLVRQDEEYTAYKNYLMSEKGLDHCMVLSHITSDDAPIEMHHGPILTLYDIASIVIDHLFNNGEKITTYLIADIIIKEHWKNNIQVVMLCETVHELVHSGDVWLRTGGKRIGSSCTTS